MIIDTFLSLQYAAVPYPEFALLPDRVTRSEKCNEDQSRQGETSELDEAWKDDFLLNLQPIGHVQTTEKRLEDEGENGSITLNCHPCLLWIWITMLCQ